MANKKISSLNSLGGTPDVADIIPITDVSDTTGSVNGTTKKVTVANLVAAAPQGDLVASNNLSDVASASTARTNLGLGTAATQDVGTANGNLVQLDSTGLPAVDGSQLTNLPSGGSSFNSIVTESTTARTLSDSDVGKIINCTNASDVTITIPNGLTSGFNCTLVQSGAGVVKVEASGTATLEGYNSNNGTAGQYASVNIYPTGTDAYILDGTAQAISPAGTNDLHYTGGIYFNSSATYYISTAPEVHFDAAILDGSNPANNPTTGSAVSSFGNRSGSSTNYDASQSTGANQPTYRLSSGLSFVEVAASNFLDLASTLGVSSSADLTLIQVAKRTGDFYATALHDSSQFQYQGSAYSSINNLHYMMGTSNSSTSFADVDLNSLHIIVSQRNSGSWTVWLNSGSAKLTGTTNTASANLNRLYQGSNTTAVVGDYYETLHFQSALSVSDINIVRAYLANKYSITSSAFS